MVYIPTTAPAGLESVDDLRRWVESEFSRIARSSADDALLSQKIITFSRVLTLASGVQSVTGVGFKPRLVMFQNGIIGGTSWGAAGQYDGISNVALEFASGTVLYQSGMAGIQRNPTAGDFQIMSGVSLDADGFTVSWSKTGTPTGTVNVTATCVR